MKRKIKLLVAGLYGDTWREEGEEIELDEGRARHLVDTHAAEFTDDPTTRNVVPVRRAEVEDTTSKARKGAERAVSRAPEEK